MNINNFNNEHQQLQQGLRRVCVVDIDVHHGNGTQDLMCRTHNPALFYASVHAHSMGDDVSCLLLH
jgi:acetoin utilization deacetylase AcuC-like enzyme